MATKPYATGTGVSVDQSRQEIQKLVTRLGATRFMYGSEEGREIVVFEAQGRRVRFEIPIPDAKDAKEVARRWRGLVLRMKAKVVAVEDGMVEFEEEFLANIALADGRTVGEFMRPQLEQAYQTQEMPALLPGITKEPPALC